MTVPHITIKQISATYPEASASVCSEVLTRCNNAISAYNEKQANQPTPITDLGQVFIPKRKDLEQATEQYITAEEAWKLGAGKAEFQYNDGTWKVCGKWCVYNANEEFKYRAIQPQAQPEPVEPYAELKAMYEQQVKDGTLDDYIWEYQLPRDKVRDEQRNLRNNEPCEPSWHSDCRYHCTPKPTCQVRNEDTGELKTMTRDAAQKLQAETTEVCDWLTPCQDNYYPHPFSFNESGIYTYKLKANLVKLDGELMTTEAAVVKWESKKDTCDLWINAIENGENDTDGWCAAYPNAAINKSFFYQLRPKSLKQVSWKDMPMGVMTNKGELCATWETKTEIFVDVLEPAPNGNGVVIKAKKVSEGIALAPAAHQPWIARHGTDPVDIFAIKGIEIESRYVYGDLYVFRITGIAEGWVLK